MWNIFKNVMRLAGFIKLRNLIFALSRLIRKPFAENDIKNRSNGDNVSPTKVPVTQQNNPATPAVNSEQPKQILEDVGASLPHLPDAIPHVILKKKVEEVDNDETTLNASGATVTQATISKDKTGALDHTPNDDEFFDALGEPYIAESADESEVESKAEEFFDARSELSPDEENGVDGDAASSLAKDTYRQDDDSAVLQTDRKPTEVTVGQNIGFAVDPVNVGNFGLNQGAHGPSASEVSEAQAENTGNVATFENDKYYSTQLSTDGKFQIVENLSGFTGSTSAFALFNVGIEAKGKKSSAEQSPTYKVADFKMDREAAKGKSYTLDLENGDFSVEVCTDHARMYLHHFFEKKLKHRKDGPINKTFEYTCKPSKPEDGTGKITPGVILLMDSSAINLDPKISTFSWENFIWGRIKNSTAESSTRVDRSMFPAFGITLASEKSCELTIHIRYIQAVFDQLAQNPSNILAWTLGKLAGGTIVDIINKIMDSKGTSPLPDKCILVKGEILNDIQNKRAKFSAANLAAERAAFVGMSLDLTSTGNQGAEKFIPVPLDALKADGGLTSCSVAAQGGFGELNKHVQSSCMGL